MASMRFWKGFATGAAAGAGISSWVLARAVFCRAQSPVVRLEKSVQIGRPIDDGIPRLVRFRKFSATRSPC
jgi:hypothetical protein